MTKSYRDFNILNLFEIIRYNSIAKVFIDTSIPIGKLSICSSNNDIVITVSNGTCIFLPIVTSNSKFKYKYGNFVNWHNIYDIRLVKINKINTSKLISNLFDFKNTVHIKIVSGTYGF